MARVTHKDIDEKYKVYKGEHIKNWSVGSNLLQTIRKIHMQFDLEPPIPENVALAQPQGVAVPLKEEEQPAAEDSQAKLKRLVGAGNVEAKVKEMIRLPDPQIFKGRLQALSIEELEELCNNEQYLDDFLEEQPEITNMLEDVDKVRQQTLQYAEKNMEYFEIISKLMEEHNTNFYAYKQKGDQLKILERQCADINAKTDVNSVLEIIKKEKNQVLKEADEAKKGF